MAHPHDREQLQLSRCHPGTHRPHILRLVSRRSVAKIACLICCEKSLLLPGGLSPRWPSIGQQLQYFRIQRQRRHCHLPLKQKLIHQLPQPGHGAKGLEVGAAVEVRVGHGGRSAGPDGRAGWGQGPASIPPSAAPAAPKSTSRGHGSDP